MNDLVAPTKALCNEMSVTWQKKFERSPLQLKVGIATGDSDPEQLTDLNDLAPYQIIITTPEKFDALTRKWKDHIDIAATVKLLLIDEVHLVGDANRGPTLETIVSRMKTFPRGKNAINSRRLRIVAVSASLTNIEDIGQWIAAPEPINATKTAK